ncbi:MAG: hypothetical protein NTU54_05840 [Candidatus Omnitrophica bacterium]|nr:hypothetical protein [Candidatus Omnitrophota bacterium]
MKFDDKYFARLIFTPQQVDKNLKNALRNLDIAKRDTILDVKFTYAYSALIKAGIALLSFYNLKVRSISGHHVKIIEMLAKILKDEAVEDIGNVMRSKRNLDLYSGGAEITEKEVHEYIRLVEKALIMIQGIITDKKP